MNAKSMLFACTLSHGILNNVQWLSRLLLIGRTSLGMGLYFAKAQQNNFIYCRYGLYLNIFKGNTEVWFIRINTFQSVSSSVWSKQLLCFVYC